MMDYTQFSAYIEDNIEGYLKNLQTDCIQMVSEMKNNGVLVDTLVIHLKDYPLSPAIPVRPYYESYRLGTAIDTIMEKLAGDFFAGLYQPYTVPFGHLKDFEAVKEDIFIRAVNYERAIDTIMEKLAGDFFAGLYQPYTVPFGHLKDFEAVKEDIFIRAVNYERNKVMLSSCPYVKKLDLALTFRVRFFQGSEGLSSLLIDDRLLSQWSVTKEVLYEHAMRNTMAKFPPVIESSEDVLGEMLERGETALGWDSVHVPLYILTNNLRLNGATAAFYPGVLKEFSEHLCSGGTDFYLLPSSIHEMMLVPSRDDGKSAVNYQRIVVSANQEVVRPEEVLSDSVYMYTYGRDEISISTGQTI